MPSQCPYIQYIITSTNCGVCPNVTNDTSVSCLRFNITTYENHTCMFAVQTEVCGSLIGNRSDNVILNLNGNGEY